MALPLHRNKHENALAVEKQVWRDVFQVDNNAIYGKCMQNRRKEKDVKAITKWGGRFGMEARAALPNFHSNLILSEDLVVTR